MTGVCEMGPLALNVGHVSYGLRQITCLENGCLSLYGCL